MSTCCKSNSLAKSNSNSKNNNSSNKSKSKSKVVNTKRPNESEHPRNDIDINNNNDNDNDDSNNDDIHEMNKYENEFNDLHLNSKFFVNNPPRNLPTFTRSELSLGSILGTGGFCKVFEITKIISCCDDNDNKNDNDNNNDIDINNDNDDDINMNDTDDNTEIIDNVDHDVDHDVEHEHNHDNNNDGEHITQTKFYMSQNVYRNNKGSTSTSTNTHDNNNKNNHKNNARYAIKILHTTFDKKTTKRRGMYDLAVEASYLSALDHPNIIKMRGSLECGQQNSSQSNSQFAQQEEEEGQQQQKQQRILHSANPVKANGFFIVMDRLYDTLQEKIDIEWTKEYKDGSGSFFGLFNKDTRKLKNLFLERLIVAHDLAKVFQYLHEKKIIYRDLRPENAGFDVRGDIKLFDFGLCKEIPQNDNNSSSKKKSNFKNKMYKLTGRTGSIPYMAPEVMLCKKYNHKVDVYSFGILLWELFALKIPCKGFNNYDYIEKVCKRGYRPPKHDSKAPVMTKALMSECWEESSNDRPEFDRIANIIRGEMNDMTDDMDGSIRDRTAHLMNRSMNSMHRR